ncbi:hypothetical protein GH733_019617 [Mirounga leonina]|nr:hypothetical protein GH733_019617 [Mirounga leonina]
MLQADVPDVSESKKKDRFSTFFTELRAVLQTREVNPETSREQSDWIPSFQSYEDFKCKTLQRGDVDYDSRPTYEYVKCILTVTDISNEPLLLFSSFFPSSSFAESCPTYLPLEDRFYLVGSISLLRDQTLRELFTVKKPEEEVLLIQDSDEEHVPPECRSQDQKRISRMELLHPESAAAASDVSPAACAGPRVAVPFSHRRDQADILTAEQYDPQESVPGIGVESDTSYDSSASSLESILASPATSSPRSFDFEREAEQVYDVDEVQQVDEMEEVDQRGQMDEMGNVEQGDEEEEVEQVEEVEEEGQLDQVEQEARSPSNAAAGISDEPIEPPPSITSYIHKRELELMKKFKEQLEEKTLMLQADLRSQKDALGLMQEQLQKMQGSSFQIRGQFHALAVADGLLHSQGFLGGLCRSVPHTSCAPRKGAASDKDLCDTVSFQMQPHVSHSLDRPESHSLEPVPKKQRTEQMKVFLPDLQISLSCGSCSSHSFKFSEELEEPGDVSSQVWKACFSWGAERRFHFHNPWGPPGSPEAPGGCSSLA